MGVIVTGSTHAGIAHILADRLQLDAPIRGKLVAASTAPDETSGFTSRHHSRSRTDYVRGHVERARYSWLKGSPLAAAENLGYALHFVADATVPSASLSPGHHDAFERSCAVLAVRRRRKAADRIICPKCRLKVSTAALRQGRCDNCKSLLSGSAMTDTLADLPVDPSGVVDLVCDEIWKERVSASPESAFENALRRCTWLAAAVFCPPTPPSLLDAISRLHADFGKQLSEIPLPSKKECEEKEAQINAELQRDSAMYNQQLRDEVMRCRLRLKEARRSAQTLEEKRLHALERGPARRIEPASLRRFVSRWVSWLLPAIMASTTGEVVSYLAGGSGPSLTRFFWLAVQVALMSILFWRVSRRFQTAIVGGLDRVLNGEYHHHRRDVHQHFEAKLEPALEAVRRAEVQRDDAERRASLRPMNRPRYQLGLAEELVVSAERRIEREYLGRANYLIETEIRSDWYLPPEIPPLRKL